MLFPCFVTYPRSVVCTQDQYATDIIIIIIFTTLFSEFYVYHPFLTTEFIIIDISEILARSCIASRI